MSVAASLRRRVLLPLHAAWSGTPRLREFARLERTQWHPTDVLLDGQRTLLADLLRDVAVSIPFYRARFEAHGVDPEGPDPYLELRKLPTLDKPTIRDAGDSLIRRGTSRDSLHEFRTGGSTGEPLTLWITEECSELRNACAWRHDTWSGWRPGEPIGALWGNPSSPGWKARLRRHLLSPTVVLDTMELSEASVAEFAADWSRHEPTLLFGHAHSLYQLALEVERQGIRSIAPRAIISTSMSLVRPERERIEKVFGVPVTDRYGCEEVSLIASECEQHRGMHLNVENLVIEFLDGSGRPVAPGDEGRVVVTDLRNRAMPFLRYDVGDVGVPSSRACPCGRGLPLMERISGRTADFLVRRDGARVAGISLIENTLTRYPGIRQLQIVQEESDRFRLRVVQDRGFDAATRSGLVGTIRETFGDVRVELESVDRIPPEPSGKYRFSICHVKQPER